MKNIRHVDEFSKFNTAYTTKRQNRVLDKMTEVLGKNLGESEKDEIEKFDEKDNMFID